MIWKPGLSSLEITLLPLMPMIVIIDWLCHVHQDLGELFRYFYDRMRLTAIKIQQCRKQLFQVGRLLLGGLGGGLGRGKIIFG